jgi:DNA-binding Xre family transcriptional regulator
MTDDLKLELGREREKHQALVTQVRATLEAIDDGEDPKVALGPLASRVAYLGHTKWTPERVIDAVREWYVRFGEAPAADDWRPWAARAKNPDADVSRWVDGDWPSYSAAVRAFGGWHELLDAAGVEPKERENNGGRNTWDLHMTPEWTGWELMRGFRERAGYSQREAAERAGMQAANFANIENGRARNPTVRTLLAIARGLGVAPGVLLEYRQHNLDIPESDVGKMES